MAADDPSRPGLLARLARMLRRGDEEPAPRARTLFTASDTGTRAASGGDATPEAASAPPASDADTTPATVDDGWTVPLRPIAAPEPDAPLFSEARLRDVEQQDRPADEGVDAAAPAWPADVPPPPPPVAWDDDAAELSMLTAELRAFADEPDEAPVEEALAEEALAEEAPADAELPPATEAAPPPAAPPPPAEPTSTADSGQRIRVHDDRIDRRPGPIRFSPSEAIALAKDGPKALHRRTGR